MLSAIVFTPMAGALLIGAVVRSSAWVRRVALLATLIDLTLALVLFARFSTSDPGFQWVERVDWIPAFNVEYFLGVDGLSVPLVLLTGLLGFVAVLASWHIGSRVREYFMWLLALQTGVMGVFISLDFLLVAPLRAKTRVLVSLRGV